MCDTFIARLKNILRTPKEVKVDAGAMLVELGVDSIVALDIHAWFLQEVEIDVSAFKILGGGSIEDLVRTALDKIPTDLMQDDKLVMENPPPVGEVRRAGVVERTALSSSESGSEGTHELTPARMEPKVEDPHIHVETPIDREL